MQATAGKPLTIQSDWTTSLETLGAYKEKGFVWDGVHQSIVDAYCQPKRHYHNLSHITSCLQKIDLISSILSEEELALLRIIVWYHDVVYDPKKDDNEEQSAHFFVCFTATMGCRPKFVNIGAKAILSTALWKPPEHHLEALLHDIDHSVLGGTEGEFLCYCRAVRQEYSHLSLDLYAPRRRAIFRHLLKEGIFKTEVFKSMYEQAARNNLETYMSSTYPEARE